MSRASSWKCPARYCLAVGRNTSKWSSSASQCLRRADPGSAIVSPCSHTSRCKDVARALGRRLARETRVGSTLLRPRFGSIARNPLLLFRPFRRRCVSSTSRTFK